jgi:hypothetical protein
MECRKPAHSGSGLVSRRPQGREVPPLSLAGSEELSDAERDALLQLCRERQDHLLFVIQGAHGGAPGQEATLTMQLNRSWAAQSASER